VNEWHVNNNDQIELVKRICEGDVSAFYEIVDLYKKKIYYIAYNICGDHHEAEDISQEVFIKVYKYINKFRFDAKLSTWIYQISVNTSIDAIRKKNKKQDLIEPTLMDTIQPNTSIRGPEEQTSQNHSLQQIRQAIPGLSKKEQTAFVMHYFNGFNMKEIAEIMALSINTIKTLLLRARRKLRFKLASGGTL
jgi:RNA polymerase sigma-70 factor, ECF subfamily